MNKLSLPGTVWIASDIHLGDESPATARAFYRFLALARDQADAVILCGDIFNAWIGDDYAREDPPQWLAEALTHFRQTAAHIPLWMGRGNRDFLMSRALTDMLGAELLPDTVKLHTLAGTMLLSHGDEYCTDDHAYQRLRKILRSTWFRKIFLMQGLPLRRRIADWGRQRSKRSRGHKTMQIMDVNPLAITHAIEQSGCDTLIHGHTHRPAIHHIQVQGRSCTRIVLPDWDYEHQPPRAGWLILDAQGPHLVQDTNF
ncbi:UDP-2,3-diacylglucosamine diphosphatase [Alcaligenaceae bacterium CGII-47]|nr:UDP-2,3-diacylglucosamine diphosphatase [Alcaligenaceae bacterium CGII-47]